MKQNNSIAKQRPYVVTGVITLFGTAVLACGYFAMQPVTRDPNIGAALILLLGCLMVGAGIIGSVVTLLIHMFRRLN
jgi:hypothetical protein